MPIEKDPLLESARLAEEKVRGLLEQRAAGDGRAAPLVRESSDRESRDALDRPLPDDGTLLALTEPDGSCAWALRLIPDSGEVAHLPDDEPHLPMSALDALARAAPQVAQALRNGRVFELIGPAAALEGLRNRTLEMIPAKTGGLLGGLRRIGEKQIVHQARFRPVRLASAVGPGLAVVAASAALGHMHMVEIRRQLATIEGKLDRVLEAQQAARHGKLLGSVEVLQDLARTMGSGGTLSALEAQRLTGAELDVRQTLNELEQLHRRYADRTDRLRGASLAAFADALGTTRALELDDARLLVAAAGALVMAEQLLATDARITAPATVPARESALRAARERLADTKDTLNHLQQFHLHCRRALDEDHARTLRLRPLTGTSDRISEQLRLDRLDVGELLAAQQRLADGALPASSLQVIRVDARAGLVRAQVALLAEGPAGEDGGT